MLALTRTIARDSIRNHRRALRAARTAAQVAARRRRRAWGAGLLASLVLLSGPGWTSNGRWSEAKPSRFDAHQADAMAVMSLRSITMRLRAADACASPKAPFTATDCPS